MPLFRYGRVPYIVQYNVACRYLSFVDRHRFVPGPALYFHVDADPDSEWHHNNAGPHVLHMLENFYNIYF